MYIHNQKGYLCFEKAINKMYTSRHVIFARHILPYHNFSQYYDTTTTFML